MRTHLLLPEYDPVEEELQILVCIINAKLLKAVEGQILLYHTHTCTCIHKHKHMYLVTDHVLSSCHDYCVCCVTPGGPEMFTHLKPIYVQYGDGEGVLARVHLSIDPVCQPVEEQRVQDLGNSISGVHRFARERWREGRTERKS